MKRTASMALFHDPSNRRVTRAQLQHIMSIFPFLSLPAELREIVYFYCFSFKGLEAFFNNLYLFVKAQAGKKEQLTKVADKRTPTVLLINRQIFSEAIVLIRKHAVTFHHGSLNTRIRKVITPNPIQQLSSIEITDHGHRILEKDILSASWHGYTRLIKDLSEILQQGHHLKNFTLRLTDKRLVEHTTNCVTGGWDCGFRDQLHDAASALLKVRGVKNVTIEGIEAELAKYIKRRMESDTIITFESLPQKILDTIYSHALDRSDISKVLAHGLSEWRCQSRDFPDPKVTTPTILLLNKKITTGALAQLHKKPLNIDFPAEKAKLCGWKLPRLLSFIRVKTLRQVKVVNITLEHYKWAWTLVHPLSWMIRSCDGLQKLTITIKEGSKKAVLEIPAENYPKIRFHEDFKTNRAVRDLDFGITGEVPDSFLVPLVHILVSETPMAKYWIPFPPPNSESRKLMDGWE